MALEVAQVINGLGKDKSPLPVHPAYNWTNSYPQGADPLPLSSTCSEVR
jgi:hypothetical protein